VPLTEVQNRVDRLGPDNKKISCDENSICWLTVDFTEELRYQTAEMIIFVDICLVNNQQL